MATALGSATPASPYEERPNPWPDCPRLDDVFRQLLAASDRAAFAAARALPLHDGRVDVIIRLKGAEGDLVTRYDLVVKARAKELRLLEAQAAIDVLCDLSNDQAVVSVEKVVRISS